MVDVMDGVAEFYFTPADSVVSYQSYNNFLSCLTKFSGQNSHQLYNANLALVSNRFSHEPLIAVDGFHQKSSI